MKNSHKILTLMKNRGVSQLLGSLFMLAIVVPIGSVILTQGMNDAAEFNHRLSNDASLQAETSQEDVIFEHIRFVPNSTEVIISLRNTGTVDATVSKITIVKTDTQDLLYYEDNLDPFLSLEDVNDVSINADLPVSDWDAMNTSNPDSDYKISIITSRGNFFESIARPFNT